MVNNYAIVVFVSHVCKPFTYIEKIKSLVVHIVRGLVTASDANLECQLSK